MSTDVATSLGAVTFTGLVAETNYVAVGGTSGRRVKFRTGVVASSGGSGLPAGGSTGQVLAKQSNTDGDAVWVTGSAPVDAAAATKGITRLSVAPASPTAPIAVGTNDTRVTADQAVGTASIRTLGTGAAQAAAGDHSHTGLTAQAAGTPSVRAIGATGTTVVAGDDARLSDTRTPTDATVTAAKLATALKSTMPGTNIYAAGWPARPSGYAFVIWNGGDASANDPSANMSIGDLWFPDSE